jgi:two-component system chemotaxis response regulator CheY
MARVLTVVDSVSLRRLVAATLTQAGHDVTEASNGAEGLEAAKKGTFNLVISDLNMPIMDGLTFIKHMRGLAAYKFTPILVLTTEMDPDKKKSAKEAGATGWIVKPFDPEQLLTTIRKVLG